MQKIEIYNTLTRKKEVFEPINYPFVGIYVCGPTVYGDAHLGHGRAAITFDLVYRYLSHLGYKVRYVRNITDVGHLENDADSGEDKIAKKARLEQVEPMEIVQYYTERYHQNLEKLNVKSPSIEPKASGHIIEQIKMIQDIIDNGFAYVVNESVYFDVVKYNKGNHYGKLSGRIIEDLLSNTRELEGQNEKKNPLDFALWKKASPEHIMRWPSPWGSGFPGWHIECSAMSTKYLGETFDIHGGGMDLLFPHHECEIAQSQASNRKDPAKYWMHNNMITINGQKMGKSLGNSITLDQFFSGDHPTLNKAYSPMTIRFFILQAHYGSTLDFSNETLDAARKAYKKIINGLKSLKAISYTNEGEINEKANSEINKYCEMCFKGMNDDFNSAVAIANLFNLLKYINSIKNEVINISSLSKETFTNLKNTYSIFVEDILGLKEESNINIDQMMDLLLKLYSKAKSEKDYATVDMIRSEVKSEGVVINDLKKGISWSYEE
ncbi:MAG: cysteine--tRNA ligase [Bacteroidetes bacterium]|nr:cysteine--tRNA ligase [Bacteroidota bacterium]HET6245448.1 cysteine--tRNA ligase [Bacteroidia bacterium]